jgi:hypothetical protein
MFSITNGLFFAEAAAVAMKHPLPALAGRFVRRFPPANAKGPVHEGLRLGREFFVRTK